MATCPECEFDEIDTADHEEGDTLSCPECGKNLVLLGHDELDFADDDEEDDSAHGKDHDGLHERGQAGDDPFHFTVVYLTHPAQHLLHLTALFTDGDHMGDQCRKFAAPL